MRFRKVRNGLTSFDISNDRTHRHTDDHVFAASASTKLSRTLSTIFALMNSSIPKIEQCTKFRVGLEIDSSPVTAIASIRAAFRDVFLAPPRDHPVAALAGFDANESLINKVHSQNLDYADDLSGLIS